MKHMLMATCGPRIGVGSRIKTFIVTISMTVKMLSGFTFS